jgi:hypothetical protein
MPHRMRLMTCSDHGLSSTRSRASIRSRRFGGQAHASQLKAYSPWGRGRHFGVFFATFGELPSGADPDLIEQSSQSPQLKEKNGEHESKQPAETRWHAKS